MGGFMAVGGAGVYGPGYAAKRPRFATRVGRLVGVGMLVFFATTQAASAATVSSVTPAEGCPGDVVTFHGSGFKTGGSRPSADWNDEIGIHEQFGDDSIILEHAETDVLPTKTSTEQRTVVPLSLRCGKARKANI